MQKYNIPNPIQLGFDPILSNDKEVREVFKDPVARTIWMAIKTGHIVDQYFNRNCIEIANRLRKEHRNLETITEKELQIAIGTQLEGSYNKQNVVEALLPYINGDKELGYSYSPKI